MAVAPSQPCILPSQSIAILYAAASAQVNFLSGSGTICSAPATMNPYPDQNIVIITAQCNAPNNADMDRCADNGPRWNSGDVNHISQFNIG